jgi:hypothetical protein
MTDKELNSHDLAREIEIVKLQEENEELKSILRGTTHCFDEEEHNKLKEENQELKKQLEEKENIACNWKDSCLENAGKIEILETQQKVFIKYLEDEISKQKNDIFANALTSEDIDLYIMKIKLQELEEILQKCKEIIGVSDEKEN